MVTPVAPGRRCPATRCPNIITTNARYCPQHARDYNTQRGTPTTRGYGPHHRKLRAQWQTRINQGEHITCWRCHTPITGTHWHLGHHDHDRETYNGPECVNCNTTAGGQQSRGRPKPNRK